MERELVEICSRESAAYWWLLCTVVRKVFFPLANPILRPFILFFSFYCNFVAFRSFFSTAWKQPVLYLPQIKRDQRQETDITSVRKPKYLHPCYHYVVRALICGSLVCQNR